MSPIRKFHCLEDVRETLFLDVVVGPYRATVRVHPRRPHRMTVAGSIGGWFPPGAVETIRCGVLDALYEAGLVRQGRE